jgi:hypothetical protein
MSLVFHRLLTDRIVDRRDPEYPAILRIGSGSHSDFKFARSDRNAESDPLFQKDLDLEYDPRKSDRSEAWSFTFYLIFQYSADVIKSTWGSEYFDMTSKLGKL